MFNYIAKTEEEQRTLNIQVRWKLSYNIDARLWSVITFDGQKKFSEGAMRSPEGLRHRIPKSGDLTKGFNPTESEVLYCLASGKYVHGIKATADAIKDPFREEYFVFPKDSWIQAGMGIWKNLRGDWMAVVNHRRRSIRVAGFKDEKGARYAKDLLLMYAKDVAGKEKMPASAINQLIQATTEEQRKLVGSVVRQIEGLPILEDKVNPLTEPCVSRGLLSKEM